MATIGELVVKFTADGSEFTKSLNKISAEAEAMGGQLQSLGSALSKYVTLPMIAAGSAAIYMAASEEAAGARMGAALKNIGADVGRMSDQLNAQFTALQKVTTFADDEYVGAFTNLANITGKASLSLKAVGVAADLAAAKGMTLEDASKLVGKALAGQTEALKKQGIFLSANANQTEVLAALTKKFGGAAAIMADTISGKFNILKNTASDVAETFGKALFPSVKIFLGLAQTLVTKLQGVADWFAGLSENSKRVLLAFAGIVAAIGPVIAIIGTLLVAAASIGAALSFFGGFAAIGTLFTTLAAGAFALLAPIALLAVKFVILIAVFAAFYANGQQLVALFASFFGFLATGALMAAAAVLKAFSSIARYVPVVGKSISASMSALSKSLSATSEKTGDFATEMSDKWANGGSLIGNTTKLLKDTVTGVWDALNAALASKKAATTAAITPDPAALTAWQQFFQNMKDQTDAITAGVQSAFMGMGTGITDILTGGTTTWMDLLNSFLKAMLNSIVDAVLKSMLSLSFLANAFNWIAANPFLAAFAIVGLIAGAKAVAGSFQGTKLAEGGITTGPTQALVGDNPSGKEAIIPLDSPQAASLLGGGGAQSQTIVVELDGREMTRAVVRGMPSELRVHGMMRS